MAHGFCTPALNFTNVMTGLPELIIKQSGKVTQGNLSTYERLMCLYIHHTNSTQTVVPRLASPSLGRLLEMRNLQAPPQMY